MSDTSNRSYPTNSIPEKDYERIQKSLDELGIEPQRGSVDFPEIQSQLNDTDDIIGISIPYEEAMAHVSEHKYESDRSVIREYISNLAATCLEATQHDTTSPDYEPVIHIAWYPDAQTLIMEDNGMGMSLAEIEGIGTEIGKGTNKYRSDRAGRFGIGIMSGFKGVGLDGAFYMHTRSRRSNEYTKGIWTSTGFKPFDRIPDKLVAGQYGTRFEFPFKNTDINVEEAVEDLSQYCRIPIYYTTRELDGGVASDNEFTGRSDTPFLDTAPDHRQHPEIGSIIIDSEVFRAAHTKFAEGNTVLLDVPINRNFTEHNNSPTPYYKTDVLFKSEDRDIVAGPHKGKIRVSDKEYETIDDELRDKYIPASQCSPSDIWKPGPAGDRDRLEENPEFWHWLHREINRELTARLNAIGEKVVTGQSDIDLSKQDLAFLGRLIRDTLRANARRASKKDHLDALIDDCELQIDPEVRGFSAIFEEVDKCIKGKDPWSTDGRKQTVVADIISDLPSDATVWMGQRPSKRKADVVYALHSDNVLVRVNEESLTPFEVVFGWKRLSDINEETIHGFSVPDEVKKPFLDQYSNPNAGVPPPDRELTLHHAYPTSKNQRGYKDSTVKCTVSELARHLDPELDSGQLPGYREVILFPSGADASISDYLCVLGLHGKALANCIQSVWSYVKDKPGFTHINDYLARTETRTVQTSEGTLPIHLTRQYGDVVVFHVVRESVREKLTRSTEITEAARWFEQKLNEPLQFPDPIPDDPRVVYAPVTPEFLDQSVSPLLVHDDVAVALLEQARSISYPEGQYIGSNLRKPEYQESYLYAYARLHEWRDQNAVEYELMQRTLSLDDGLQAGIDGYALLQNNGVRPPSQQITDMEGGF